MSFSVPNATECCKITRPCCRAVSPTSFGAYTALRFSGFFYAPYTAQYDFHAHGADGAIVWMDDQRTPFIAGNGAQLEGG